MKTNYRALGVVLLLAVMAGTFRKEQIPNASSGSIKAPIVVPRLAKLSQKLKQVSNPIPENTMAIIQQDIAKREYHITPDREKGVMQSPNRKHNLRSHYKPGQLIIQNRIDSAGHNFKLKLTTEGVYADGKKLFSPQTDAQFENSENTLRIKHKGFTEEYVNNERGVRQNFIVNSAPKGAKKLEVRLAADGLRIKNAGKNKLQLESRSGEQLTYSDLKCWDANGKLLGASLAYESGEIGVKVDVEAAAFPVTIDPLIGTSNSLEDADTIIFEDQKDSQFGTALSSAGDFNGDGFSDVFVGAYGYDFTYQFQGAAYLYFGSQNGIDINSAKMITYEQEDADLGRSVATAGDINGDGFSDIIIGISGLHLDYDNEGGVLIIYGNSQGLTVDKKLIHSGVEGAYMGASVSSAGDVNGDGYSDIIIGAPRYRESRGAALLFYGSASGVNENKIVLEKWITNHYGFGSHVAGAGDVNGDGYGDIIVGDPTEEHGKGAAYVYMGSSNGLITTPEKTYFGEDDQNSFISGEDGDILGSSVASAGDVNGDGYSDIIIGSAGHIVDPNDSHSPYGAAYVYYGSANGLPDTPNVSLFAQTDDEGIKTNRMGYCVASAGDINGDGFSDIIVGARKATFIYHGSSAGIQNFNFSAIKDNKDFLVDLIVSSAGDVNGDGISDIILSGRTSDPVPGDEVLAIFIFHGATSGIKNTITASGSGLQVNERLGFSLTNAGDLNGDGFNDIAIGAPYHSVGGQNNGLVRVQYGSLSGINFGNFKTLETLNAGALFGYSTSSAGDVNGDGYADLLVGASNYSNGQNLEGAVFVYHGSPTGVASFPSYIIEGNEVNAQFGFSTSGAGDINGDGYSDIVASGINNKVLVYFGSANGLKLGTPIALTNNGSAEILGRSVAGIGDFNGDGYDDICASLNSSLPGNSAGTALVFLGSQNGIETKSSINLNMQGLYCQTVSAAGDVNGDGLMDIIVGTPTFSNGESNEGAAFVYHGTSDKGIINPSTQMESNQAKVSMGYSVAGAGDINGDGYSDVIVSAPFYGNGENNEGMVNLYLGSPTGIVNVAQTSLEGNVANGLMGMAVSGAGDVNGDGYSEMLVGLPQRDVLYSNAGLVQLYAGNGGYGLRNNIRLYNSNLSENISHKNISEDDFGLGLYSKSFLGRSKARLIWETRKEGEAFSHNDLLSTSVDYTDKFGYQVGLGSNGIELKSLPLKVGKSTRVRARVKYDPSLAITGQLYGPWKYLPGNSLSQAAPLPVTLVNFTAERSEKNVNLEWITATEENSESFEVQRSSDGKTWLAIGKRAAKVNSAQEEHYTFTDSTARPGQNFYRLKMIDLDQTYTFSRVRSVIMAGIIENMINLFPNPTAEKLTLQTEQSKITNLKIVSAAGNVVLETANPGLEVDVKQLKSGIYIVVMELEDGTSVSKSIVKK